MVDVVFLEAVNAKKDRPCDIGGTGSIVTWALPLSLPSTAAGRPADASDDHRVGALSLSLSLALMPFV